MECIQPSQPQQNAYIEGFNRAVHHDWSAHELFGTIDEVLVQATRWL
jgi:putative transposase